MGKSITQEDIDNYFSNKRAALLRFLEQNNTPMKMIVVFRNYFLKSEFDLYLDIPQYRITFKHPLKQNNTCTFLRVGITEETKVLYLAIQEFIKTFEQALFGTDHDLTNLEKKFCLQQQVKQKYSDIHNLQKQNRNPALYLINSRGLHGLNANSGNGGSKTPSNNQIMNILKRISS